MHIAGKTLPVGITGALSGAEITTLASSIKAQGARADDFGVEIGITCHQDIQGLARRQYDILLVGDIARRRIVATDVQSVMCCFIRHGRKCQQQKSKEKKHFVEMSHHFLLKSPII